MKLRIAHIWSNLALNFNILISWAYNDWITLDIISSSLSIFFSTRWLLLRLGYRRRLICFFHHSCLICRWHIWKIIWRLYELRSSSLIISKFALLIIMTAWIHTAIITVATNLCSNCVHSWLYISSLLIYFRLLI